jgi:hypothetical protein
MVMIDHLNPANPENETFLNMLQAISIFPLLSLCLPAQEMESTDTVKIQHYLSAAMPSKIHAVEVTGEMVIISGHDNQRASLLEVPFHENGWGKVNPSHIHPITPDSQGNFSISLPRKVQGNDRIYRKWMLAIREKEGWQPLTHSQYPTSIFSANPADTEIKPGRKGLGAMGLDRPISDLDELNISGVTVNIVLNALVRSKPEPNTTPFDFEGHTWHANNQEIHRLDRILQETAKRRILVSAIILIGQPGNSPPGSWHRMVSHPKADASAFFVMPNLHDADGARAFGAALYFLAARYSGSTHGRIHHWIMHNEADQGWMWANAGVLSSLEYLDLYHKSLRMAHLVSRQFNPGAKAFISLTHHWSIAGGKHNHPSKKLLDHLLAFSRAEGDFDWAIAHHPYPQNLTKPRVWEDNQATFSRNTQKITFKNLEVLDDWVRDPAHQFLGKQNRTLHLTEQGFNSPDYSEKSLKDQAAGMAYGWNKVKRLPSITMVHYHNWVDNRHEFGLRIGLRKFPDEPGDPLGKKPIWHFLKAADTPGEAETAKPYLPWIGIQNWEQIMHKGNLN